MKAFFEVERVDPNALFATLAKRVGVNALHP